MLNIYQGVTFRKVGEDYLAYSPLSSETIYLTFFAYQTLEYIMANPISFSELSKKHQLYFDDFLDDELSTMLATTIRQLSSRGFIYTSSNSI